MPFPTNASYWLLHLPIIWSILKSILLSWEWILFFKLSPSAIVKLVSWAPTLTSHCLHSLASLPCKIHSSTKKEKKERKKKEERKRKKERKKNYCSIVSQPYFNKTFKKRKKEKALGEHAITWSIPMYTFSPFLFFLVFLPFLTTLPPSMPIYF